MKKLISLLVLIVLLTSCWGVIQCPTYPENKKNWIPYVEGDIIRFSDGDDTIIFNIKHDYYSSDYYIEKYGDDDCRSQANFSSDNSNGLGLRLSGESWSFGDFVTYVYGFYIPGNDSMRYVDDDFNFNNGDFNVNKLGEYTAGDKTYAKVLFLELDTLGDIKQLDPSVFEPNSRIPQIWRIAIADSVGLIQFEDRVNRKTWNLVDRGHVEPTDQ